MTRLLNVEEGTNKPVESLTDTNFYRQQQRIALRNCGVIDPENIDEYIAHRRLHGAWARCSPR